MKAEAPQTIPLQQPSTPTQIVYASSAPNMILGSSTEMHPRP